MDRGLDPKDVATQWLDAGIRLIQIRAKQISDLEYWRFAEKIAKLRTHFPDIILLINARIDIAIGLELEGVHLTEKSPPTEIYRESFPDMILFRSYHRDFNFRNIEHENAITLSPVFSPTSKHDSRLTISSEEFFAHQKRLEIPIFALGGIVPEVIEKNKFEHLASLGFLIQNDAFNAAKLLLKIKSKRS